MTTFDPEKFEEKYTHYFDELQEAYKNAFQYMHDRHDSAVLRSIDRHVSSRANLSMRAMVSSESNSLTIHVLVFRMLRSTRRRLMPSFRNLSNGSNSN